MAIPPSNDGTIHEQFSAQSGEWTGSITSVSDAQKAAATLDFMTVNTLSPKAYPYADDILAANPLFVLGDYEKGCMYQGPLANPAGSNPLPAQWFCHDTTNRTSYSNRTASAFSSSIYIMQVDATSPSWTDTNGDIGPAGTAYPSFLAFHQQLVKNDVDRDNARYARVDPFSLGWGDSAGSFSWQSQVDPATGVRYTQSAWLAIVAAHQGAMRSWLNARGILWFTNGVESNAALATNSDGVMFENWVREVATGGPATPASSSACSDASWTANITGTMTAQEAGAVYQATMKMWDSTTVAFTAAQIEAWRRYAVASYFIADRGRLYLQFNPDKAVGVWNLDMGPAWISPRRSSSVTGTLGAPRDNATSTTWKNLTTASTPGFKVKQDTAATGWVYRRRYAKGCAYVSTATNPVTVTLDRGDYKQTDGTTAGALGAAYTIPARSGVILWSTNSVATAPSNTSPPTIGGTETVGQALTVTSSGTWTGSPTYRYLWQSGTTGTGSWTATTDTDTTHDLVASDAGLYFRVQVIASNAGGDSPAAYSNVLGPVASIPAPQPPASVTAPTLDDLNPVVGDTLTITPGTWDTSLTSDQFRWQAGDPTTTPPSNITNLDAFATTNTTRVVDSSLIGKVIRGVEQATNSAGSTRAWTAWTATTTAAPVVPVNTTPPTITGTAQSGQLLTSTTGAWSNAPTSYAYQWTNTTTGDIPDATTNTYLATDSDVGATLTCTVTATNASGSSSVTTAPTSTVTAAPGPVNTAAPSITGTATVNQTLTANPGTWTGSSNSYTYAWHRVASDGSIVDIGGGSQTLLVSLSDVGSQLYVTVTATDASGHSAVATSPLTSVVADAAPVTTTTRRWSPPS